MIIHCSHVFFYSDFIEYLNYFDFFENTASKWCGQGHNPDAGSKNHMKNQLIAANVPKANILLDEQLFTEPSPGLICGPHYHDEIELLAITDGAIEIVIDEKKHSAQVGDVVFVSSRIPHATYKIEKTCRYTLVQYRQEYYLSDENNAGKYFSRFVQNSVTPFAIMKDPFLFGLIARVLDEYRQRKPAWDFAIKGALFSITAELCRQGAISSGEGTTTVDIEKIRPALTFIEENYHRDITLEDVSAVQNLNPSYFCRIFKRASGQSFVDYLNFVRVCKSEKLLATGNDSIISVSYNVGFSSVSYFNRVFKKYKNCTPTAYRKAQYTILK